MGGRRYNTIDLLMGRVSLDGKPVDERVRRDVANAVIGWMKAFVMMIVGFFAIVLIAGFIAALVD